MKFFDWFSAPQDRQVTINGIRFSIQYGPESEASGKVDLLSIPALSNAIEIKSNDVSQIPLYLYFKTKGGRQRIENDLAYRLSQQPNRYQNAAAFWKTVAMQATVDQCFISMRGGEFNILPFGSTYRYKTLTGEIRYAVGTRDANGNFVLEQDYGYREVLHFWSFQDECGNPTPMRCRFKSVLGLGSDFYTYTTNIYNRGGTVVGFLSTDKMVDDAKKTSVIQAFKALFKSAAATSTSGSDMKMAAVDNGWKFNALNLTPQEMMMLETKKDLKHDFAQIVNMPPWKLGMLEDYHYSTAEAAQREYLQVCLNPLLNQIECEINSKCISDFERPFLYVEFKRDVLITIDAKTMAEVDDMAVKNGCMSTDEWRERRNLPHGGQDIRQVPVNVTSSNFLVKNEALKLQSTMLDIEIKKAQLDAATKPLPQITVTAAPVKELPPGPDYLASLQAMQKKHVDMMTSEMMKDPEKLGMMVRSIVGDVANMYGIADHLAGFADKYLATAAKRIADGAADVAYEVNRAINAANHEAMKAAHGVKVKVRWVGGAHDGQVRGIMEAWSGNLRHPPIAADDTSSFLVKE